MSIDSSTSSQVRQMLSVIDNTISPADIMLGYDSGLLPDISTTQPISQSGLNMQGSILSKKFQIEIGRLEEEMQEVLSDLRSQIGEFQSAMTEELTHVKTKQGLLMQMMETVADNQISLKNLSSRSFDACIDISRTLELKLAKLDIIVATSTAQSQSSIDLCLQTCTPDHHNSSSSQSNTSETADTCVPVAASSPNLEKEVKRKRTRQYTPADNNDALKSMLNDLHREIL